MNAGAELVADIHARAVVVLGQVFGTLRADERIELGPTANVEGELTAPAFQVKDGAYSTAEPRQQSHAQAGPSARVVAAWPNKRSKQEADRQEDS